MQGKSGSAVNISVAPNGAVFLTNLILDGGVSAGGATPRPDGVTISAGGTIGQISVTISHCTVQHLGTGVKSGGGPSTGVELLIADTVFTEVSTGISAQNHTNGVLDHVLVNRAAGDAAVTQSAALTVTDSVFVNSGVGVSCCDYRSALYLAHSTVTGNVTGVNIAGPPTGTAISFGDNHIYGNGTNVFGGTLTKVGTQ